MMCDSRNVPWQMARRRVQLIQLHHSEASGKEMLERNLDHIKKQVESLL